MPVCISVHHTHAWGLRKLERGFRTLELGFQSYHVGTNITEKANGTLDPSIKALDIYGTLSSRCHPELCVLWSHLLIPHLTNTSWGQRGQGDKITKREVVRG